MHLTRTHGTVWSCHPPDEGSVELIKASDIREVVAMLPHQLNNENRFFLVEKPGFGFISYQGADVDEDRDLDGLYG